MSNKLWRSITYSVLRFCLILCFGYIGLHLYAIHTNKPKPRGPYLQSVTTESTWIVWDTIEPSPSKIEYGLTPELGLIVEETGMSNHHEVQLQNLEPFTEYFYRIPEGKVHKFRTAVESQHTEFQFAVLGDTQSGRRTHKALIKQIIDLTPHFLIHTGDLVESGQFNSEWDRFFQIENPLLRSIPIYPTLGNHEDYDPSRYNSLYRDVFHLPGNELWYSFTYGNALFINLKVDGYPVHDYFPSEEQLTWLKDELKNNESDWIFVYFHIGPFSSRSENILETGIRERLVPIFEEFNVDVVFTGHHHGYERLQVNDITYIITAGGGAGLYEYSQTEPNSQIVVSAHHFIYIEVQSDRLFGSVFNKRGKIIDSFELLTSD